MCQIISGAIAGLCQSIVTCPVELIKIKMQTHNLNDKKNTFYHHFKFYLNSKNGFKQLYKGMAITLLRDIPGFAIYFGVYQLVINFYKQLNYGNYLKINKISKFFK